MNNLSILFQVIYPDTRKGRLLLFIIVFLGAVFSVHGFSYGLLPLLFTPYFPLGFATFFRGTLLCPGGGFSTCGVHEDGMIWGMGWLVYVVLACAIVISSRGWRIALLWIVFIALLIFNVVGCQAINPCPGGC